MRDAALKQSIIVTLTVDKDAGKGSFLSFSRLYWRKCYAPTKRRYPGPHLSLHLPIRSPVVCYGDFATVRNAERMRGFFAVSDKTGGHATAESKFRPPPGLRAFAEWVGVIGALIAVVSWCVGLSSFISRTTVWRDTWAWVLSFDWPVAVARALDAIGLAAHSVLDAYRRIFYPIADFLSGWLPFELPSWSYDAFFVGAFAVVGLARALSVHRKRVGASPQFFAEAFEAPFSAAKAAGLLGPLLLIQLLPAFVLLNVYVGLLFKLQFLRTVAEGRTGVKDALYLLFMVTTVSLVILCGLAFLPLLIAVIDQIYLRLR